MMYTAAALAMILPLMDLHCGKSTCKVDDLAKKTDVTGLATAVELKKVTDKVSTFAEKSDVNGLAKNADVAKDDDVKKITERLPAYKTTGTTPASYVENLDALVVKKDLDDAIGTLAIPTGIATSTNVKDAENAIKSHVTSAVNGAVAVGTTGGIAGHDQLATVDNIVDELKLDLITGGTGTSTKEAIAAIKSEVANLAKEASVQSVVDQLPAGGKSKKIASADDVAAVVDNNKKYLKVMVDVSSSGKKWTIDRTQATKCVSASTKVITSEYIMCCNKTPDVNDVRVYKYDTKANTRSYYQAKHVCERLSAAGDDHELCPVVSYSAMSNTAKTGTYGGSNATVTGFSDDTDYNLAFEATDGSYEVWTNVEC